MKGDLDVVLPAVPGISYRQLDYWVRVGYLQPDHKVPRGQRRYKGTGHARQWPDSEIDVAKRMARLVKAGLPPALAARVARGESELAPGVYILVDPIVERP